ncbi:MAG: endonuclease III [Candidatus Omnitrophota bacterium]
MDICDYLYGDKGLSQKDIFTKIIPILKEESKAWPMPSVSRVALDFKKDPFIVLISCILSLRTQDATTHAASERLFRKAHTPSGILKLALRDIEKAIYPVGFYYTKARNIKEISSTIIDRFKGKVPYTLEGLLSLKGVGRKTANLVLTEGFNKYGICVDTHVHRISNRLGLIKTKDAFGTEMSLRKILPRRFFKVYNPILVAFGQNICRPVSPLCSQCKIRGYCKRVGVVKSR